MERKSGFGLFLLSVAVAFVLAACGGGSQGHTYVFASRSDVAKGVYVTLVSPVALPQLTLRKLKQVASVVGGAQGPEVCSVKKKIQRRGASHGKTVTVKINGSSPFISAMCAAIKHSQLDLVAVFGDTGPVLLSLSALKRQANRIAEPMYWAGPAKQGAPYAYASRNLTHWISYLPKGFTAGQLEQDLSEGSAVLNHVLSVVTYPWPHAYEYVKKRAGGHAGSTPDGGLVWTRRCSYACTIAWPGVPYVVEVSDPSPSKALSIAESGRVRPVR